MKLLTILILLSSNFKAFQAHAESQYLLVHVPDHKLEAFVDSNESSSEEDSHEGFLHGTLLPIPVMPKQNHYPNFMWNLWNKMKMRQILWNKMRMRQQQRKPMIAWRPLIVHGGPEFKTGPWFK